MVQGLKPQKAEAVWGHGVNPQPLICRSRLDIVVLYLRGRKRLHVLRNTCNYSRHKIFLLLLLLMAGDIESNPGPPGPHRNHGRPNNRGGGPGGVLTRQAKLSFKDDTSIVNRLEALEERVAMLVDENKSLMDKIDALENQSRRNNMVVYGIPEESNESWEKSEDTIKKLIKEKLEIAEDIVIERAHRLGKQKKRVTTTEGDHEGGEAAAEASTSESRQDSDNTQDAMHTMADGDQAKAEKPRPRPLIVKFAHWKDKERVLAAGREHFRATSEDIKVGEDYSVKVRNVRKSLIPFLIEFREQHKNSEGKIPIFLRYDKLVVGRDVYRYDEDKQDILKVT